MSATADPHEPSDHRGPIDPRPHGVSGEPGENPQVGETPAPGAEAAETLGQALSDAARRAGLGELATGGAPTGAALLSAIGGWRGIVEAILPGLLFVIIYTTTQSLPWAAAVSVGVALLATVARVLARTPVTAAVGGLLAVVASAALALWTGKAEDNFVLGFFTNAGYALALLASIALRWPLIGLVSGYLMGEGTAWRAEPAKRRIMGWLTALWATMFLLRLGVQLPLYWAGNVEWLGIARIGMGLPLYAPLLVGTVLIVRSVYRRADGAPAAPAA